MDKKNIRIIGNSPINEKDRKNIRIIGEKSSDKVIPPIKRFTGAESFINSNNSEK